MTRFWKLWMLIACASWPLSSARAQEPAPASPSSQNSAAAPVADEPAIVAPEDAVVRAALASWGCAPLDLLAAGGRWYAACGEHGVFVVERAGDVLELRERRQPGGAARAVFLRGGQIWIESEHVDARPLQALPGSATAVTAAPSAPVAPPSTPRSGGQVRPPHEPARARESRIFPERVGGVLALEGALRPVLPVDTLSFAAIAELALTYRGERHWFAQGRVLPLGGLVGKGHDEALFGASALAGYDHPYFSVGLGVGALRRGSVRGRYDATTSRYDEDILHETVFAVTQHGRLGALDGLHVAATNTFMLLDDGWEFGMVEVSGQIPLYFGTWLTIGGGGGEEAGYVYGELGLRRMIRGDRGADSLFVRPSIGVAGVDQRSDGGMRAGPMVGVHLEWRK